MDRDTFIITVYCLVVSHYQALTSTQSLRHGGFAPSLSDEEVLTLEICGEYWKLNADTDLYDYFRAHYQHFFPKLRDRTLFVRQAASLWHLKARLQQRLVALSGQAAAPVQAIETLPLAVCTYTRAPRDRCLRGHADYGHCAAKKLDDYGFKLGLQVTRDGLITYAPVLPGRPRDVNHTGALLEGYHGLVPADKGFWDPFRQDLYAQHQGVQIIVPARQKMTETQPPRLLKACARWRKIVETVGSQLTERFGVARIRARDLWHYQHRLLRKILAHTVILFLNLQPGRPRSNWTGWWWLDLKRVAHQVLLLFLLSVGVSAQTLEQIATTNTCTNRHENSFTAVGNELVLVGGRGIKPVETFNPATNTWTKKVATPIEMHHFQALEYKGELWIVGAFTGRYPHETPIPNIYIFNSQKNEWRVGPEIPKDRLRGAAAAFGYRDKIYVLCGITDGHWEGDVAWFDEYDPRTNQWRKLPDAPHVRDHAQAVVIGNKAYIAGGRRSSAKTNETFNLTEVTLDVFDFKANKWSTLPASQNLPTPRAGSYSVAYQNKMLVSGGESGAQVASRGEVEAFDTKALTWAKWPALKRGRHGTGVASLKQKLYVAAGSGNRGGGPELNTIEVFAGNSKK